MTTFFGQIFTPPRQSKVRIEYSNGIFTLIDEADVNLGYEFKNFNEAFRFAKTMGYEFSDNDYSV